MLNVRQTLSVFQPMSCFHPKRFRSFVNDEERNALIEEDVIQALKQGRQCLILTHGRNIVDYWRIDWLKGKNPFVLSGGLGKRERFSFWRRLDTSPERSY